MAEKVYKCGVKREEGWLYFLDKKGNVARVKMARPGEKAGKRKQEIMCKAGVSREPGFLYFLDKQGDVSRAKMARGKKKGTGKAKKAPAKKKKR